MAASTQYLNHPSPSSLLFQPAWPLLKSFFLHNQVFEKIRMFSKNIKPKSIIGFRIAGHNVLQVPKNARAEKPVHPSPGWLCRVWAAQLAGLVGLGSRSGGQDISTLVTVLPRLWSPIWIGLAPTATPFFLPLGQRILLSPHCPQVNFQPHSQKRKRKTALIQP